VYQRTTINFPFLNTAMLPRERWPRFKSTWLCSRKKIGKKRKNSKLLNGKASSSYTTLEDKDISSSSSAVTSNVAGGIALAAVAAAPSVADLHQRIEELEAEVL
jgi:hypothetical protein